MNTPPTSPSRPVVLCVDDEPHVLEGIGLHLRRRYDVRTAAGGAEALDLLAKNPQVAVILSDMRMPVMDGATFLAKARQLVPEATRMLLTGQADLEAAISAVNDGHIFRFLTKPCPPPSLVAAVDAGVAQHRLITAERVLLEETLHGAIKALTDVLALTNPAVFGRAMRIKALVSEIATALGMRERWQLEVAAMLSQLGAIAVPSDVIEKVYAGRSLSEHEQQLVQRAPIVTAQILDSIPRLDGVREIVLSVGKPLSMTWPQDATGPAIIHQSSHVLRAALDFDALEARGDTATMAVDTLHGRTGHYATEVLAALARVRSSGAAREQVREVPLAGLRVGMIITEEVRTVTGALLVARGHEVTASFMERIRSFSPGSVKEPLRVTMRAPQKEAR